MVQSNSAFITFTNQNLSANRTSREKLEDVVEREIQSRKVVGRQIADIRILRGLTQDQFAQRLGLHRSTIGRIESGQSPIDINLLPSIALALDVSISDIMEAIEPVGTQTVPGFGPLEEWKNKIRLALREVTSEDDLEMFARMLSIVTPGSKGTD